MERLTTRHMKKFFQLLFTTGLILFTASFFAGCSTPPDVGGIEASLRNIKTDGEDFTATIVYVNDSTRPVAIQAADHDVYFAGQLTGHARLRQPLGLPPLSSAERAVLVTPTSTLGRNLTTDAANTPGAFWRLTSQIAINYGGEDVILRSDTRGKLGHP